VTAPLHTGTGDVPPGAYVTASADALRWGRLPTADVAPIAAVADGELVTFDTVSHEGLLGDQGADPVAFFGDWGIGPDELLDDVRALTGSALQRDLATDGPHAVLGPVAVRGARPGDLVCIEPVSLVPRVRYGIVSNRHGRGVLSGEMPRADHRDEVPDVVSVLARVDDDGRGCITGRSGRRLRFDLRPFLGLIGITPDGSESLSSTPPGAHGGNLDIHHIGVGSRLLLPAQVPEAGLYVGDPHFAQGNGEVALTAFEAPLRATLRVTVRSDPDARALAALMAAPLGETATHTILVGLGPTLDEAMRDCVRRSVAFVVSVAQVDEHEALAFLSAAADFEVSQAVNLVVGVHCLIRTGDLA
jgi:acetamidase/formamidase